jgi:hypothetical protein
MAEALHDHMTYRIHLGSPYMLFQHHYSIVLVIVPWNRLYIINLIVETLYRYMKLPNIKTLALEIELIVLTALLGTFVPSRLRLHFHTRLHQSGRLHDL